MMGLDVGDARIGVAMSDELALLAHPAGIIERKAGNAIGKIIEIVRREGVETVVIGLPLNMDGSEGRQAHRVRHFGRKIRAAAPDLQIEWEDERLTTVEARELRLMSGAKRSKRAEHVDHLSAALILQSYLDSGKGGK